MGDTYDVDDEAVQRLDADLGLPGDDHPFRPGGLVTPQDMQRFFDMHKADTEKARERVNELASEVGFAAIVDALAEIGVLVEKDRWEGWWG